MEQKAVERLEAKSPEEAIIEQIAQDFNLAPFMAKTQFEQMRLHFGRYSGLDRDVGEISFLAVSAEAPPIYSAPIPHIAGKESGPLQGIKALETPCRAPTANPVCERFLGTLRRERSDHLVMLNERPEDRPVKEYQAHYNHARPHQGIEQRVPGRTARLEAPPVTANAFVAAGAQRLVSRVLTDAVTTRVSRSGSACGSELLLYRPSQHRLGWSSSSANALSA